MGVNITRGRLILDLDLEGFNALSWGKKHEYVKTVADSFMGSTIAQIEKEMADAQKFGSFDPWLNKISNKSIWYHSINNYDCYLDIYLSNGSLIPINMSGTVSSLGTIVVKNTEKPGGDLEWGDPLSFQPPTPTTPDNIGEVPFYDELKKTHDLLALDGLSEEEWDYLKAMVQKEEVMKINGLLEESKNDYMKALGEGAYDNVFISHDPDDPVSTAFFEDNGLDKSLEYNANLANTGLGYKDINGNYKKMDTVLNFNKIQQLDDNTYSQMMTENEYVAFLGTLAMGGLVVGGSALTTYAVYQASKNPEAMGKVYTNGMNYLSSVKDFYFGGFTNDGDRQKDLVNPNIPSYGGTYNTKLELNGLENGINLNSPTTGVDLNVPSDTSIGLNVPTDTTIGVDTPQWKLELTEPTFGFKVAEPSFNLDLNLDNPLPLELPAGGIDLNVTGKEVGIVDGGKVQLDIPEGTALPVDGLDDNFKAVYANKAGNLGKTDIILANKIESHNIEYVADGGVRGKEKVVADWKDLEYKTPVLDNGTQVNKISRDIKAWQGMHSLNPSTEYEDIKDSSDNNMDLKQGLIPSLVGMGIGEYLREGALKTIRENNVANITEEIMKNKPKSNSDDSTEEKKKNILLGLKNIMFPKEGDFESVLKGEFGDDFIEIANHFLKTEVK